MNNLHEIECNPLESEAAEMAAAATLISPL